MSDRSNCVCGGTHGYSGCPYLERAVKLLGDGARIGINAQYPDEPYFVGKWLSGEWKAMGFGKTLEEALTNVKKVKFQRGNGRFVFEEEKKDANKR